MHAELTIAHRSLSADDLNRLLRDVFGEHNPKAFEDSRLYGGEAAAWRDQPLYASQNAGFRVICMPSWTEELQVFVEVDRGDLRRSAESAWNAIRSGLSAHRPRVVAAEILDFATGQTVLRGQTGLHAELRRHEVRQMLAAGVATIAVVAFGWFTFAADARSELIAGAAPGFATAAATVLQSLRSASQGRLRWPE